MDPLGLVWARRAQELGLSMFLGFLTLNFPKPYN